MRQWFSGVRHHLVQDCDLERRDTVGWVLPEGETGASSDSSGDKYWGLRTEICGAECRERPWN